MNIEKTYTPSIGVYGEKYHNPICPHHSSKTENSHSFVCDQLLQNTALAGWEKLQKLKRRKSLTLCLQLLEKHGLTGDVAIFVLSEVGGEV